MAILFLGFALAPISELTLIATGVLGVVIAIVYLNLQASGGSEMVLHLHQVTQLATS